MLTRHGRAGCGVIVRFFIRLSLPNSLPLGFPPRIPDKPLQAHRRLQLGFQRMIEQQRPGQVGALQRAVAHLLRHVIDVKSANKPIASLSKS